MQNLSPFDTLIMLASIVTAGTVIFMFFKKGFAVFKKFIHFLDDFNGEEERPGSPRRPGMSERIGNVEEYISDMKEKFQDINDKVSFIEKELHPNHGSSMRDAIDRIQMRIDLLEERTLRDANN